MKDDECLVRMTWKAQEVIQDRIKAERWILQWMFADFVMQKQAKTNLGIFENDLLCRPRMDTCFFGLKLWHEKFVDSLNSILTWGRKSM